MIMANSLHCDIVSVTESIFTGKVTMVIAHMVSRATWAFCPATHRC
jgi:hypothetical protein